MYGVCPNKSGFQKTTKLVLKLTKRVEDGYYKCMKQDLIKQLSQKTPSKIIFLILDGLGDLPIDGKTALGKAHKPNIDSLFSSSIYGLMDPIAPGITPGSGPAHLSLFGYDPLKYEIGRGLLGALGIGFEVKEGDVCARGNFCTLEQGIVTDRRAGRISTEKNKELCEILSGIKIEGIEIFVQPEKEHRFLLLFRGDGLSANLSDSDPQKTGFSPLPVQAADSASELAAVLFNRWLVEAEVVLKDKSPANMVLLRGFAGYLKLAGFSEMYKLNAACIASYPMYKGLANLLGMDILATGDRIEDEAKTLIENYDKYDFFFLHIKGTDKAGEDGDYQKKVAVIEETDKIIPEIIKLNPDVLVITGDHSTPALLKGHSCHPVPLLLYTKYCISDEISSFSEKEAKRGALGRFPMQSLMGIVLGYSGKLAKYGA